VVGELPGRDAPEALDDVETTSVGVVDAKELAEPLVEEVRRPLVHPADVADLRQQMQASLLP